MEKTSRTDTKSIEGLSITELNHEILSRWMLSGYRYVIATIKEGRVNLHPIFKEVDLTGYDKSYLLPSMMK